MSGSLQLLAMCLAIGAALPAQSSPPMVDSALRNRFGFLGPKVHKIGDGINLMQLVDLDGDGRDEIVVNHGERGRLTILRRKDHDAIESEFFDTDGTIYGLGIADVDGDKVPDFVMHNRRGRMVVKLRGENAPRVPEVELGSAGSYDTLRLGDVDSDGVVDAVVLLRSGVRVVTNLKDGQPRLGSVMPIDFERTNSFLLEDVDGDSHLDIVLLTSRNSMPLHVKRGNGKGGFGPWIMFRTPKMHRVFDGPGSGGKPTLSAVQDRRARIVDYRIDQGAIDGAIAPQLTSLKALKRGAFPFAHGDVDGDGDADLVLAHPERAELVYLIEDGGQFRVRAVPSLARISSIALGDHDADGKIDVVVTSPEEEVVAWKSGARPMDAFPQRLPSGEKPIAATVDADGSILFITKDKKRQGKLHRLAHGAEPVELGAIGRLSGDPQRLVLADVDPTPGRDLVCVVPSDGLRVVQLVDGKAKVKESGTSAGFSKKVEDGALTMTRTEAGDAMMIVRNRFARIFRIDAAGEVEVARQVNAPADAGELSFGAVFSDGRQVLVDRKSNKLYVVADDKAPTSFDLPPIGATHLIEHEGAAVLIGRSGVLRVPFGTSWRLSPLRNHEPPTEDTNYWLGLSADLDGDGVTDVALLDEDINGVQLLTATDGRLDRALGFPVFELPEKRDQVYEPRAIAVGDWNGDDRDDLVLISHDRVLIYRQEK